MNDCRLTIIQMANALTISSKRVEITPDNELGMTKLCVWWVSGL